jgi:hypothetical protein
MGILSGIMDTIFGDEGRGGQQAQQKENAANREFIRQATDVAREDVNRLFPEAAQSRLQGFQGAQDIFASSVPQQLNAFQQGNLQAQTTAGLAPQQIQNALLGLPVDFGFLQPQEQFQPDFSFLNQPLQPSIAGTTGPAFNPAAGQFNPTGGATPVPGLPPIAIGGESGGVNLSQAGNPFAQQFDINQLFKGGF